MYPTPWLWLQLYINWKFCSGQTQGQQEEQKGRSEYELEGRRAAVVSQSCLLFGSLSSRRAWRFINNTWVLGAIFLKENVVPCEDSVSSGIIKIIPFFFFWLSTIGKWNSILIWTNTHLKKNQVHLRLLHGYLFIHVTKIYWSSTMSLFLLIGYFYVKSKRLHRNLYLNVNSCHMLQN